MLTRRWLVGAMLVGATLVLPPAWQTCTSTYDQLLNRWETVCPDGTRAVSTWNALLERWETCATKCCDGIEETSIGFIRKPMSPWAVASGGIKPEVKKLALKCTREARGRPPRREAWLRHSRESKRRSKRPTGKRSPVT